MVVLQGIKKSYGTIGAIRSFYMEFHPGTIYGLVGPNGAGKTTLLKILAGILYFDEGSITAGDGKETYENWCRKNVIYIPSGDRGLRLKNTAYDNILYYGILKGIPRKTILQNLNEFSPVMNMDRLLQRRVEQLSTGERKKTAVLCGLCSGVSMMLLDEPSIGVDIDGVEDLKQVLKSAALRTQNTLIISSHDTGFLSELAQEYLFILDGKAELRYKGPIDDGEIVEQYRRLKDRRP